MVVRSEGEGEAGLRLALPSLAARGKTHGETSSVNQTQHHQITTTEERLQADRRVFVLLNLRPRHDITFTDQRSSLYCPSLSTHDEHLPLEAFFSTAISIQPVHRPFDDGRRSQFPASRCRGMEQEQQPVGLDVCDLTSIGEGMLPVFALLPRYLTVQSAITRP
jgi:hypothetical protein